MNENELRTYCFEHAGEPLPAEAEALLNRDPQLKKQVEQLIMVSKLVSLKKYEQPHAACLNRCIQSVNARIEERRRGGILVRVREWFDVESPASSFAYAAAALLVCAAGVGLFVRAGHTERVMVAAQETAPIQSEAVPEPVVMVIESIQPAVEEEQIVAVERETYPAFDKPLIVLQVNSNPQPSSPRMQFGPGTTVPVRFDY